MLVLCIIAIKFGKLQMNDDLSTKRVLVYDDGLFTGLTWYLAKHFGEVMYFTQWQKANPTQMDMIPGSDYEEFVRVRDFWDVWKSVDLFVFPDCFHDDLQLHLQEQGKRVWGSRKGVTLEMDRWKTKQLLKELGLPVQPCQQINGLDRLISVLKEKENCFVKMSRWRGDMESWHHINMELSGPRMDELAFRFGPFKNEVVFVVEDEIPTNLEVGYDGINIDGQWPDFAMQGYEAKDSGLLAAVMPYKELPELVRYVNEKLAPTFKKYQYRNFFSSEIRVSKDNKPYLIDCTTRQPSPSGEIQIALYENLGEIMWHGSAGEMVPIKTSGKFAAEAMIYSDWAHKHWMTVEVDEKVQPYVTLFNSANVSDTVEAIVPMMQDLAVVSNEIGAVIGIGDTLDEAVKHLKENAEGVTGMGVEIKTDALARVIQEIEEAQKKGMKFSDKPLPKPESVLT